MVFALNPNSTETFDAFQSAAANAMTVVPSEAPQGGTWSNPSSSATSSSGSPSPTNHSAGAINAVNIGTLLLTLLVIVLMT